MNSTRRLTRLHLLRTALSVFCLAMFSCGLTSCGKAEKTPVVSAAENAVTRNEVTAVSGTKIRGVVRLNGIPPKPAVIKMGGNPECTAFSGAEGGVTHARDVLIQDGKVQNVFVYLKDEASGLLEDMTFTPPQTPVVINNEGCRYEPRVVGIQAGQPIQIRNADPTLHNVHAFPKNSKPFNIGLPVQGSKATKQFDASEVMVSLKCDLHSWMQGWIGVVRHPYFDVSAEDGTFAFVDVPPGTYTVEAWHERLGTLTQTVTVSEAPVEIAFVYTTP